MISVSIAVDIVKRETGKLKTETVKLADSIGRILAENIVADSDMPPFDRSQMDGYAVIATDTKTVPTALKIVGESAAGRGWHKKLKPGEAVRIMTGGAVPAGADAIQKIEVTKEAEELVTIEEPTEVGRYIVKKGAEIKRREKVIDAGERVNEKLIASLAAFGYSTVRVSKRPTVAILGTGSEIVDVDKKPGRDQIRNSNSVMLKALCEQVGATARILPQASDDLKKLQARISGAVTKGSDILVITGGVSVGKYDLTKAALHELGAQIYFERVRLRPGKPTVLARVGRTLIFGLPGNPVSAAVTFYLFVRTAILKMQGARNADLPAGWASLTTDARAAKERDTYFPATLTTDGSGRLLATPLRWHGSSDFVGFARADALIYLERGQSAVAGDVERIVFL